MSQSISSLTADGTLITSLEDLPIEPRRTDVVYNGKKGRAWIWDIAVDKNVRKPFSFFKALLVLIFRSNMCVFSAGPIYSISFEHSTV